MKGLRLIWAVLYACYLVQAGLLMTLLPWSDAWSLLVLRLPPVAAAWLDHPSVKGLVTAFGVLHFLLIAVELRPPSRRSSSTSRGPSGE